MQLKNRNGFLLLLLLSSLIKKKFPKQFLNQVQLEMQTDT